MKSSSGNEASRFTHFAVVAMEDADDWPRIYPEGGRGRWSDCSSLPGRTAGRDCEAHVRKRLTGSPREQPAASVGPATLAQNIIESLKDLEAKAIKKSQKDVGLELWNRIFGNKTKEQRYVEAVADAVLEEETDLLQSLGEGARLLLGEDRVPAGAVVEIANHGALFYYKCFQLEKYLTIWFAQHGSLPPAAVLVINKNPIRCEERWIRAIQGFPNLNRVGFSLVYFPHSLHIDSVQEIVAKKDERLAEKDKMIAFLTFCLFLCFVYYIYGKLHAPAGSAEL